MSAGKMHPDELAGADRIRLRKPRGVLAVTLPLLPGSTPGGDAGRCLLVVSPDTRRTLEAKVFPGVTAATDAASRVLSLLAGIANPPPREPVPAPEVLLTDMHDLHDALAPPLAGSGVQIDFHEHIPELAETRERFIGHLRQRAEERLRGPGGRR